MQNLSKQFVARSMFMIQRPARHLLINSFGGQSIKSNRFYKNNHLILAQSQRSFFGRNPPPDFDVSKDYYKVLEVKSTASQSEVKNNYYRLCQYYHPDRNSGQFQEKFKDITSAYQVIGDEEKRKRYDALRKGESDPMGGFKWGQGTSSQKGAQQGQGFSGFQGGFDPENLKRDLNKMFKNLQAKAEEAKKRAQQASQQQQKQWNQQQSSRQSKDQKPQWGNAFKNMKTPNFSNYFSQFKNLREADKRKLIHTMVLVFGSLMMLKLVFGGRHRQQMQYYDPNSPYGGQMPDNYGGQMPDNSGYPYTGGRGGMPQGYPPVMQPQYQQYIPQGGHQGGGGYGLPQQGQNYQQQQYQPQYNQQVPPPMPQGQQQIPQQGHQPWK